MSASPVGPLSLTLQAFGLGNTPVRLHAARRWALLSVMAVTALAMSGCSEQAKPVATARAAEPQFVGSERCAGCHAEQFETWRQSQHRQAMQPATAENVLAPFNGESLRSHGVTSLFSRRDGQYQVRTEDADGRLKDFAVTHTFGVTPLQQYLVALPGGRLQALGLTWDTRPAAGGGQRWIDLYPATAPRANDPMHWTGAEHNWNYMCADCHTTNFRKNYDMASDTYRSSWSELGVGCEACHGPASNHLSWAERPRTATADPAMGLPVAFDGRRGATWTRDSVTGQPRRNGSRSAERELDVCARCHSLRSQITDEVTAADPLAQGFHLALLDPGLYWPDGQMRDEVYNHGSFLQSRMYAKGVVCSDCHEPHSQKLRVPGDGVCLQCHDAGRYTVKSHHMHDSGSTGARCAACHMPVQTYMQIDQRHDHSLRIPQPALSARIGAPNPCTDCHRDRSVAWAEQAIARAHPQRTTGFQTFGQSFADLEKGKAGAANAVLAIASDKSQPAIVRASAIQRLTYAGVGIEASALDVAMHDPSPMVRSAAAQAAGGRTDALMAMLSDPQRSVRITAITTLLQQSDPSTPPPAAPAFAAAKDDYLQALRFNGDRTEARSSLGQALAASGDNTGALAAYQGAIKLDRGNTAAYVGLADTYRILGDEANAERSLRTALSAGRDGRGAAMLALGLLQYRQGRRADALASLAESMRLEPDNVQIIYTYAVALHDLGKPAESMRVIERALARRPDAEVLRQLLEAYGRERG